MTDALSRLKDALSSRYTIERELGRGGMATVYLAQDLKLHRKVAVKVLRPELAAALGAERFLQEIDIAAKLTHPHILGLHDCGEADGFLYYVMPYIEGESLRDKLAKEGELPIAEAVRILRDVVDALSHAHKHSVVHRDIKPDNVMLSDRHALVTDFGVAKAVSEATGRHQLTTEGVALGTPAYMAPEQAAADPHIDHRADIYAVGVIAYELLTGRTPFVGNTQQELLAAHVTQTPDPVTKYRDAVSPALAELVMRCLKKKPADRWQTADELLPQLEALATPSGGVTPTGMMPATAGMRRWFAPIVVAAAIVLILIGVVLSRMAAPSPITITTSNILHVTSEPGMEWQPALSPDGSQVAFVSGRDMGSAVLVRSTVNVATGGEVTLAEAGDRIQRHPLWSSDGEFIRFASCAGGLCSLREAAKLGGSIRSIDLQRNVEHASWSPDGSRVAVFAEPDSIFTYSIGNRTTALLAVHPVVSLGLHSPTWSPDGKRLAYVNGNQRWLTSFNVFESSIWIVDGDGGEPVRVTGNDFMDVSPAWLDDSHLLFVSNRDGLREVYVVEVGATGPRGEPRKVPGVTEPHSISYSVAGSKLAFSRSTVRQNIWSYRIRSGLLSITDGFPVTNDNAVIEAHDVSRDGRWIVYSSNLRGNLDIYKRSLEGGTPIPLTDSPVDENHPRWSPNGTEIAFHGGVAGGERVVMVVPADGGTPIHLVSGSGIHVFPSWSPSGLDIAFVSYRTGRPEAWLVSRESIGGPWGEPTQLTSFGCHMTDWAPDGSGVICSAGEEIVLVSRAGEVLWRYDLLAAGLQLFSWSKVSWAGSTVYFAGGREDGSAGIWAVPTQGGEPRLVVAYDDAEIGGLDYLSVGPDNFYITVGEYESDIWVMDVEVER